MVSFERSVLDSIETIDYVVLPLVQGHREQLIIKIRKWKMDIKTSDVYAIFKEF